MSEQRVRPVRPDWAPINMTLPVRQVGAHSYYAEGRLEEASAANESFISNAGFVITGDGVVVFDSLDSPALADRMIQEIRQRTAQPIRLVVISHYHADHFYGMPAFRAVGAKIWANALGQAYLKSDAAGTRLAERRRIVGQYLGASFTLPLPDKWIGNEPQIVHMGDVTLTLYHLGPSHTTEDEGMLVETDGVMYSGDVVYTGRVPFIGTANTKLWLAAIDRLLSMKFRVMVPGHGPASYHARQDAQLTRDYIEFLRQQMGKAARNLDDFDSAYSKVDWSRFQSEPTFDAANRGNAYSVYLEMQHEWLADGTK